MRTGRNPHLSLQHAQRGFLTPMLAYHNSTAAGSTTEMVCSGSFSFFDLSKGFGSTTGEGKLEYTT